MLFAGLECEDEGALAVGVLGGADYTTGHLAELCLGAGDVAEVWAAEAEGHAEGLAVATGDVAAPFCGSAEHCEGAGVGVHGEESLGGVELVGQSGEVLDDAVAVGLGHEHAGHVALGELGVDEAEVGDALLLRELGELDAVVVGVGAHDAENLLGHGGGDEHAVLLACGGYHHHHDLGGSGGAVVHRGVGALQAVELGDHALVLEDVLEGTLGDFGLVGGVGGVELAALEQVGDGGRGVVVVDAAACEDAEGLVLAAELVEVATELNLAHCRGNVVFAVEYHLGGDVGVEFVDALEAYALKHVADVSLGMGYEFVGHLVRAAFPVI